MFGKPPKPSCKEEVKEVESEDEEMEERGVQTPKFKANSSLKEKK